MAAPDIETRVVPLTVPAGLVLAPIDLGRPLSGARMKGFPLLHLFEVMGRSPDPSALERWRESLPEAHRAATDRRAITSITWLPIEYYFHAVAFAARALYGDGARHALRVGQDLARADIGAFFRFVLAMASPATVLNLSGRFWRSYFDVSSLTVTSQAARECTVEVRDWPLRDEVSLHELGGSLVAWMEASRAGDVRLERFELLEPGRLLVGCRWA